MRQDQMERLTQTGPGTPCGALMRRYWQPVALSEELAAGAPVPIKVLGEELVLFRDDQGRPGLLGLHCAHRGADLSYGRLEDGGIRCIYHGWLYDGAGRCLEQPGEPEGSTFHERIRQVAYPCDERAGSVFAYLGPGELPPMPGWGFLHAPATHVVATKHRVDCNYLQGTEGSADPSHLSFLHHNRFSEAVGPWSGRGAAPGLETLHADVTDSGFRVCKVRRLEDGHSLFVGSFELPTLFSFLSGPRWEEGYCVNWHVPIDDTHYWEYAFDFSREGPLDEGQVKAKRWEGIENYRSLGNKGNRYRQDREKMKTDSYCGIGGGFAFDPQDVCVLKGMGVVQDRSQEHLVSADLPLVVIRQLLNNAIRVLEEGREPPRWVRDEFPDIFVYRGRVPGSTDWKQHCRELAAGIPA